MKKKKVKLRAKIKSRPKTRSRMKNKKATGGDRRATESPDSLSVQKADEGLEVMSQVILDFAGRLLETCDDRDAEKKAISLAIFVWNATLLPEAEQKKALSEYLAECRNIMPATELETLSGYIDRLVRDKADRFADNRKKVTNCTFGDYEDERHIEVGYIIT
jgi:hypothetical protein